MKKSFFIVFILFNSWLTVLPQSKSIQERLGFSKEAKLLIIHADDLGLCHSENMASIKALENGSVNSGSILVPSPWFSEIAEYASNHTNIDFGLHLDLTCEWKYYKWGPISAANENSGLINEHNYFFDNSEEVKNNASIEEVERELRAQIETAVKYGIQPTHLDTHMFTLYNNLDFLNLYIKLGKEYKLPILLNEDILNHFELNTCEFDIVTKKMHVAGPNNFETGLSDYYVDTLKSLQPGLNVILLHAAYDDDEMRAIAVDHLNWGANWRQQDFDFFTSDLCKKIIEDENIQLITWKEIKEKLID